MNQKNVHTKNKPSAIKKFCGKHKIAILLVVAIILQTLVYIKVGIDKSYIHMDEAYSLGLASYDKTEIQDNADFYDAWHDGAYYEDYLALNDDEMNDFTPVYENQRNDVHPPLYYLFLRIAMIFSPNHFSKWGGIVINIIIYAFITIFDYLIIAKLMGDKPGNKTKAVALAFVASITLAALTNVTYIRMYALAALNIVMVTYLHMKLYEKYTRWTLAGIGLVALIGSLTHYFFLFYLAMLFVIMTVHFIRQKEWRKLVGYVVTLVVAAGMSLAIFPYSIQHMLFSNRGDGVVSKLTSIGDYPSYLMNIGVYLGIIQFFAFNSMLVVIVLAIIGLYIYRKVRGVKTKVATGKYLKLIYLPTLFYTLLVAISSPWLELRYIAPVCAMIFVVMFYWLWRLLESAASSKVASVVIYVCLAVTAVMPIIIGAEPQVVFSDKREIVQQVQGEYNVPTVFWFNSSDNRFLDDILLFSLLDESYVAKDADLEEGTIQEILAGHDLSRGILVFINGGQQNDDVLQVFVDTTELDTATHVKRMNACDIYYLK